MKTEITFKKKKIEFETWNELHLKLKRDLKIPHTLVITIILKKVKEKKRPKIKSILKHFKWEILEIIRNREYWGTETIYFAKKDSWLFEIFYTNDGNSKWVKITYSKADNLEEFLKFVEESDLPKWFWLFRYNTLSGKGEIEYEDKWNFVKVVIENEH